MIGCSGKINDPVQSIYLFKDKDGLYEYNPTTDKEEIIYKVSDDQVFLDEPIQAKNDTLTFGFRGKFYFRDSLIYSEDEKYGVDYISVDMRTGKSWLSKRIFYNTIGHTGLNIKEAIFRSDNDSTIVSDTTMGLIGRSSTYKGVTYNNFKPRFYSAHVNGNKSVFSLRGKIYLVNKNDTSLLVNYEGGFDPKFGKGYFQPHFNPTGEYVIFRYLPGFMNFTEEPSLQKVDLHSKKVELLKIGEFNETSFSDDGSFILFKRKERESKNNTWISDIYVMDMNTLDYRKIGEANSAQWIKK